MDEDVEEGSVIYNTASVLSDTFDPDDSNNITDIPTETTVEQSTDNPTDMEIIKTASSGSVVAGETLTYTLQVINNGPAPATSVVVVDALPDGVTFVSAEVSGDPPEGTCNSGVTCLLGDMEADETVTITVVVNVDSGQFSDLFNIARVSSANPELDPSNNEDSAITEVNIIADIGVTKSADPDPAVPGAPLTYEIVVTNYGPSGTPNAVIFDDLPQGLLSPVVTHSQGACTLSGSDGWIHTKL